MSNAFTKQDLPFLVEAMDRKAEAKKIMIRAPGEVEKDKVGGEMNVPKPVVVDENGTMSQEDYKKCSMIMAVCQNMVQKTLLDAAKEANVEAADALKNMNAWVQAYANFPFPFFNFKDTQSDVYQKNDFSLTADPDVVENIVNIKGLPGLKDAVVGALQKAGGNLASYEGTDREFNYFGIITGYNETEIAVRVIKFQMHLKKTKVNSLCVSYEKTNLDTAYDTYQFVGDKELMIKMQDKMGDLLVEFIAEKLLAFIKAFYEEALGNWRSGIVDIIKKST